MPHQKKEEKEKKMVLQFSFQQVNDLFRLGNKFLIGLTIFLKTSGSPLNIYSPYLLASKFYLKLGVHFKIINLNIDYLNNIRIEIINIRGSFNYSSTNVVA